MPERARLIDLFSYFKAVEQHRSTPVSRIENQEWSLRLSDLPKHASLQITDPDLNDDNTWLTLRQPEKRSCPIPDATLKPWLLVGWDDPDKTVGHIQTRTEFDAQNNPRVVTFTNRPGLVQEYARWCQQRLLWADIERPTRAALRIWERLNVLSGQIKREGESIELVLGDVIFDWRDAHHPILLRRVELTFESSTREFRIAYADTSPELYSALFSGDGFDGLPVKSWQDNLLDGGFHPLGEEGVDAWMRAIIGAFPNGEFIQGEPKEIEPHPRIGRSPVLFLRKREFGRVQFIDEILNHLRDENNKIPSSLLSIVGCAPKNQTPISDSNTAYANEEEDILLSKPANAAQLNILRRLKVRDNVLVQGPPGTGKTHTIANLIGSLLAEGKSVLVTSHTTKALRVLRDQVEPKLQPLCVSVLDSDKAGRNEMLAAVNALAGRIGDNLNQLQSEASSFSDRRKEMLKEMHTTRRDLETAVNGEYQPLILAGQQFNPTDAAKIVAAGIGQHNWIPGPLSPISQRQPAPFSDAETQELYASSGHIKSAFEADLALPFPSLDKLWPPEVFEQITKEFSALSGSSLDYRRNLWSSPAVNAGDFKLLLGRLPHAVGVLAISQTEPWRPAVLEAGIEGNNAAHVWELFCKKIEDVERLANEASVHLFHHTPNPAETNPPDAQIKVVDEIILHLEQGKNISIWTRLLHPQWKRFIDTSRIGNNAKPSQLAHFQALRMQLHLMLARTDLVFSWQQQMEPHGAISLNETNSKPEQFAVQFVPKIRSCLAWYQDHWMALETGLAAHGLNWQALANESPASNSPYHRAERLRHVVQQQLPGVVEAELRRRRRAELLRVFNSMNIALGPHLNVTVLCNLHQAVVDHNPVDYRQFHALFETLLQLQPAFFKRQGLLEKLHQSAPAWAESIQHRSPPHDKVAPPGSIESAWQWIQFNEELDRRASLCIPELQKKIEQLSEEIREETTNLIDRRAWAALIDRIGKDTEARFALKVWAETVKKTPKGNTPTAQKKKRDAQKLMAEARRAVPVWIMPFSRIAENFHPARDRFDVLIVDEASQEDVLGIAPFYLADKVIIVGDDEQVTPLDVGGQKAPIDNLMGQWLGNFPIHLSSRLFGLKDSIFDRAKSTFDSPVQLVEHFRCVPEIIQFSNELSYGGNIKPLRESSSTPVKPPLVAFRVTGQRVGDKNTEEAEAITSLIAAAIEQPEYADKSFGVIALMGDEQSNEVEKLLLTRIDPVEYEKRRILCGKPSHFQGDERDVIFLSMVDSKDDGDGPLGMRQDTTDGLWKKRYNVAASRAKDQLWVVYSLDHQTQLKPGDFRRLLIEHAIDPSVLMRKMTDGINRTQSPFEAEVYQLLVAQNYRVYPQWEVGAYRIDLVVESEDGKNRLAIECDGNRWHRDTVAEDLGRQALLERLKWRFVRIGGISFYRDRASAMKPVFQKLQELGIAPVEQLANPTNIVPNDPLLDRVKRRASELRQSWVIQQQVNSVVPVVLSVPVATVPQPEPSENEMLVNKVAITQSPSNTALANVKVGQRVQSAKFGDGTVKQVTRQGQFENALVVFDVGGEKLLPRGQNGCYADLQG